MPFNVTEDLCRYQPLVCDKDTLSCMQFLSSFVDPVSNCRNRCLF